MDCSLNECGVCASESVVAFCENCNFRICGTCFQLHKKSTKLFHNHVAFLIEQTKTILTKSIQGDHAHEVLKESLGDINTHKCSTHTTENLVFFCIEHTETLCGRCVFSCHKSCKVVDLFEVHVDDEEVHACKSHLQNLVENLKSNEKKIEKNTYENNECKLEFLKDLQQLRTDVIAWFDSLQSKCEQQCSDTFETNAERLTPVRTFCQEHIKRFQERQELIDNLLTQNHVKRLYVLINKVKKEIEEIKLNLNWPNSASTLNRYVFKRSSGIEELLNSRPEIGGLDEWCSGSDEIFDDTLSSLTTRQEVFTNKREDELGIATDRSCALTIPPRQSKSANIGSQGDSIDRQYPPKNVRIDAHPGREKTMLQDVPPSRPPIPIKIRETSVDGDGTSYQYQVQSLSGRSAGLKSSGAGNPDKHSIGSTNEKAAILETNENTSKNRPKCDDQTTQEYDSSTGNNSLTNGKYSIEKHGKIWCLRDISSKTLYPQTSISATSIVFIGLELLRVDNVYYQIMIYSKGKPLLVKCDDSESDFDQ